MAMTDQTHPDSGAIDIFAHSHFPLNLAAEIKELMEDEGRWKFSWFNKLQILLQPNEGVLFDGNVFHQIHGNFTNKPRLMAFWVLENKDKDIEQEYTLNNLKEIKWDRYNLNDFEGGWITERSKFMQWNNENEKIQLKIDWEKEFQFLNKPDEKQND